MTTGFWVGKRVLVTGHTGFKGAWLSLWLHRLGAQVTGFSLGEVTTPSLFAAASVGDLVDSEMGDVRQADAVAATMSDAAPEVVFHLAAQALVPESYRDPVATYATNVMGTAHVLEAVRGCDAVRAVIIVTSDKCYENREWVWGYREIDPMGGHDPYSSSKGCTELLAAAWRRSYFGTEADGHSAVVATARAGNVVGGGDWAANRLIPDCIRAAQAGEELVIRYPQAVRPWQFVLEPLRGYLQLAEQCLTGGEAFGEAWNFGPRADDARTVEWLVERYAQLSGGGLRFCVDANPNPHESHFLGLDCAKAAARLGWRPCMEVEETLAWTASWYDAFAEGRSMQEVTLSQIGDYERLSDV